MLRLGVFLDNEILLRIHPVVLETLEDRLDMAQFYHRCYDEGDIAVLCIPTAGVAYSWHIMTPMTAVVHVWTVEMGQSNLVIQKMQWGLGVLSIESVLKPLPLLIVFLHFLIHKCSGLGQRSDITTLIRFINLFVSLLIL